MENDNILKEDNAPDGGNDSNEDKGSVEETLPMKEKLPKKKKLIIIAVIVLAVAAAAVVGLIVYRNISRKKVMESMTSGIQTTRLTKKDLTQSLSVTGTIASSCSKEVSASVKDIEVSEVLVSVGDYVNAGDVIVRLDSSDLEDDLEDAKEDDAITRLKQQQTLGNAQDSVTDAQETYDEGVAEQAEKVSDAYDSYVDAANDESNAQTDYNNAVAATANAKTAYENALKNESTYRDALTSANTALATAKAALETAQATYDELEAKLKYMLESDANYSTTYDAYTAAYTALQTATADVETATAAQSAAQKNYDTISSLRSAYEQAQTNESNAYSKLENAQDATNAKLDSYNDAVDSQTQTNEKNAKNVEESKESLTITSKEVSKSLKTSSEKVEQAVESVEDCDIVSPIDGYITSISVEAGDTYSGDTLFVVQDLSTFIVEATVDEYDIASLAKGQTAVVKTDATEDEEFTGEVTYVALTPDSSNGSQMGSSSSTSNYSIEITLNDTSDKLRVGMTAKTSIILEEADEAFSVPYDCIEEDSEGSYITVLDGDSTEETKKIYVTVGLESDYYVAISADGLEEGMKVVTPTTVSSASTEDFDMGSFNLGDITGGMTGGGGGGEMPSGGGMSGGGGGGGMPSGGGPGGF